MSLMRARLPPTNPQAEQALLGALIANNRALERVDEFLRPDHFADPLNARIYALICEGVAENRVCDAVTLIGRLGAEPIEFGDGQTITAARYLANLLGGMVGIINAGDYGRVVHDAWLRRCLIEAGEQLVNDAMAGEAEGSAVLEAHEATLLAIVQGAGEMTPPTPIGEAVRAALALTQAAQARDTPLAGLTTGYAALDRMTAGMMPQQFILLGARPSMGKTALGLGIAVRAAAAGAHTLFWSGEMAAAQLGARIAAAHTGLPTTSVFTGRRWDLPSDAHGRGQPHPLTAQDWSDLIAAEKAAFALPLAFDTRSALSVQALRARARRMRRAKKLDLLVVDYVGLMRGGPDSDRQKLYERITDISSGLQALAKELDIPVLVMAQLNRANEAREEKTPQLSDLRDSGALEQDANVVMFLHRPHYYLTRSGKPARRANDDDEKFATRVDQWHTACDHALGQADVSVAKNRNGPTGNTRLRFHDETSWFRDEAEDPAGPAWQQQL